MKSVFSTQEPDQTSLYAKQTSDSHFTNLNFEKNWCNPTLIISCETAAPLLCMRSMHREGAVISQVACTCSDTIRTLILPSFAQLFCVFKHHCTMIFARPYIQNNNLVDTWSTKSWAAFDTSCNPRNASTVQYQFNYIIHARTATNIKSAKLNSSPGRYINAQLHFSIIERSD